VLKRISVVINVYNISLGLLKIAFACINFLNKQT
jgi:hypothetical protein